MMRSRLLLALAFAGLFLAGAFHLRATSMPRSSMQQTPEPGTLPSTWIDGTDCENQPDIQVHAYNEDFFVLRQNKCLHFEAPFLFLIFGSERALLLDTGSTSTIPLRETVDRIIEEWLARTGTRSIELIVAHSHDHFDHIVADDQFVGRPDTTIVGHPLPDVQAFFGFTSWPEQVVQLDLGGRVLDVLGLPGHRNNCIALYDRRTQVMLTGDSFYPGFLFVFTPSDWPRFQDSIARLLRFGEQNPVRWYLGCHIEISADLTPFPYGTQQHPNERHLELTHENLIDLHRALTRLGANPDHVQVNDVVITPVFVP